MVNKRIVLSGRSEILKPQITSLLAMMEIIQEQDMGYFVGYPAATYLDASRNTFELKIRFESKETPPYGSRSASGYMRAAYTIPAANELKINWSDIKVACGGKNGYDWGHWGATAFFTNNRYMRVNGATRKEAETRLTELLKLSTLKVKKISTSEVFDRRGGGEVIARKKTRMYPAYFTVINNRYDPDRVLAGTNPPAPKIIRVPLWTDQPPPGIERQIQDVLNNRFEYQQPS